MTTLDPEFVSPAAADSPIPAPPVAAGGMKDGEGRFTPGPEWETFFPPGTRVIALPNWNHPRLYVPSGGPRARWRGSSLYPAFKVRARLFRVALRTAAAAGLAHERTAAGTADAVAFARDLLPGASVGAVLMGTPGQAQKVIVQFRDSAGSVAGYLKFAEKPVARRRLEEEHRVLQRLPAGVAPVPLKYAALGAGQGLLLTPVPGHTMRVTLEPGAAFPAFIDRLVLSAPVPLHAHPWLATLPAASDAPVADWLETLAHMPWPVVARHGDLAPWNMLCAASGQLAAIDWEYGSLTGFPFIDAAGYVLTLGALIYGWQPREAMSRAIGFIRRHWPAVQSSDAHALTRLAAFDLFNKSAADGHGKAITIQQWRRRVWETPL